MEKWVCLSATKTDCTNKIINIRKDMHGTSEKPLHIKGCILKNRTKQRVPRD